MNMKEFLEKLLARKKEEMKKLEERNQAATTVEEVREVGETLLALRDEINDIEMQLAELEKGKEGEGEGGEPAAASSNEGRSFNPLATFNMTRQSVAVSNEGEENPTSSMEYRKAFMEYVQRGKVADVLKQNAQRTNNYAGNVAEDLGILIPKTVVQEIIKGVEKVYGQLYSRVKKTNLKGGVRYPIGSFNATFSRIVEYGEGAAPTARQKGGSITGHVQFSYNIGEIRLAKTLLESVLEVPVFEQELSKVIVETYVKAMDKEIMVGDPDDSECEGILTEAAKGSSGRIPTANIIEFTAEDMADWTKWQELLFAKIPLSMRSLRPEFVMTPNTYEANIKTLKDDNNRPLYVETFNPVDGAEIATFKGKQVCFVEDDILGNFNDEDTTYFGMYWVPERAYAINTNLEFFVKRYFDDEKNEWVDKALVINDGKILDPKYLYLLKKKASEITA